MIDNIGFSIHLVLRILSRLVNGMKLELMMNGDRCYM